MTSQKSTIKQLLGQGHFLKLWLSQASSQLTIYLINFVFLNRIYRLTKSPLAISFLWLFYALPSILLAPISGFFVDLWDKRKILLITNLLQALVITSYLLVENQSYYFIYIIVFAYSLLNQLYVPAESASIPWLVKKKLYPLANSLFLLTSQFSLVLGFGLGSLLTKFFQEKLTVILAASALGGATIAVSLLPPEKTPRPKFNQWLPTVTKEIKGGWEFVIKKRLLLLYALGLMSLFQVITVTASLLLPVIAEEIIRIPFLDAAPVIIFSLGLGLILGSLFFSRLNHQQRKKEWIVWGLGILGITIGLISAGRYLNPGLSLIFTASLLFFGGGASVLIIIPAQTFIQEATPQKLRGRIFGLLTALVTLAAILPTLLVATLVEVLGVIKFIWLIALGLLLLASYLFKNGDQIILATSHRP